jgi:hypothetical protein
MSHLNQNLYGINFNNLFICTLTLQSKGQTLSSLLADPFGHSPLRATNNRLAAVQSEILSLAFQVGIVP